VKAASRIGHQALPAALSFSGVKNLFPGRGDELPFVMIGPEVHERPGQAGFRLSPNDDHEGNPSSGSMQTHLATFSLRGRRNNAHPYPLRGREDYCEGAHPSSGSMQTHLATFSLRGRRNNAHPSPRERVRVRGHTRHPARCKRISPPSPSGGEGITHIPLRGRGLG
jgi:hypothetical protein